MQPFVFSTIQVNNPELGAIDQMPHMSEQSKRKRIAYLTVCIWWK